MEEATLGAGDVEIDLGGDKVVLRPSLRAAMKLTTQPGGLSSMVQRCSNLDIEAISDVIITGGSIKVDELTKELIFETGLLSLAAPCITYLNALANGGKLLSEDKNEDKSPLAKGSQ